MLKTHNTLKAGLDIFWRDQDMLYDYRAEPWCKKTMAELTGIGSR